MQTLLHTDTVSALQNLGVTEEVLVEAARQGYLARANCTPNHPPLFPSFVAWGEAVKALRDGLAPMGWVRSNERNWPRAIHPDGHLAITVATGNEATGRAETTPATTSSKGPSTVEALEINRLQAWLPGLEPEALEAEINSVEDNRPSTWLLLVHHAKNEIRSELSLPLDVNTEGRVSVWRERILLKPIPIGPEPVEVLPPPSTPDIDVTVRRKA